MAEHLATSLPKRMRTWGKMVAAVSWTLMRIAVGDRVSERSTFWQSGQRMGEDAGTRLAQDHQALVEEEAEADDPRSLISKPTLVPFPWDAQ